jgi:hypothetical protein
MCFTSLSFPLLKEEGASVQQSLAFVTVLLLTVATKIFFDTSFGFS